jgi:hypothetical protein
MKASGLTLLTKPPHAFTVHPSAFTDSWLDRPQHPIRVGMRRASADEFLAASIVAVKKTDEHFPGLAHSDPRWDECYQVINIHVIMSRILTHPENVAQAYWPYQAGEHWVRPDIAGKNAVSQRFTREGIERLCCELEVLSALDSPVWDEATDRDLQAFGRALIDGTFFPSISIGDNAITEEIATLQRAQIERQIRMHLTYVMDLHSNGKTANRPPLPLTAGPEALEERPVPVRSRAVVPSPPTKPLVPADPTEPPRTAEMRKVPPARSRTS